MARISFAVSFVLLAMSLCNGQTAAPDSIQSGHAAPNSASVKGPENIGHGAFRVKVTKTLDSSRLKQGDIVQFTISGAFVLPDGTRVPEKAKVSGHLTEAEARSKGDSESRLGIVFDQIDLADGKQLTIKAVVQAVGLNPYQDPPAAVAGFTSTTDKKYGSNAQSTTRPSPIVNPKSTGVHGVHGLQLGPDGVLTSDGKRVKVDSGLQIIARGEILK